MLFHPVSAASRSVVFSSCPQARGPCWFSFIASQSVADVPEMQGNCSDSSQQHSFKDSEPHRRASVPRSCESAGGRPSLFTCSWQETNTAGSCIPL